MLVPPGLIGTWRREFAKVMPQGTDNKFSSKIRVWVLHGSRQENNLTPEQMEELQCVKCKNKERHTGNECFPDAKQDGIILLTSRYVSSCN